MTASEPRQVFLFTGHMIDAPDRQPPRFPPRLETSAAVEIAAEVDRQGGAPGDLALCGGAAGGDLLFAEGCLARGMKLRILLPFERERFLRGSVDPSGPGWRPRFQRVEQSELTTITVCRGGAVDLDESPYSRVNRGLLEAASEWGTERLVVIALWDGKPGDGAGGTAEMVAEARRYANRVQIIDPAGL